MIAGRNSSTKYVQVGYFNPGGLTDCWRHFSEYNNGSGFIHHDGPCSGTGASHTPLVKYIPGTGKTEMWIDSLRLDVMSANSFNWPRPLEVLMMGETHDSGTDTPGYVGTKTDWSQLAIQYFTDDTWNTTCGNITLYKFVTQAGYAADAVACNHTRSWTGNP